MSIISQLPEACLKNKLSCLAKEFSLLEMCKARPKIAMSCKGFKLTFNLKENGSGCV